MTFEIPLHELEFRATRAGGPGGQHVNKAATRVEVVWDVAASASLTEEQRTRLLARLAARLDRRGRLRVVADEHRSQLRNREAAVERLRVIVAQGLVVRRSRKATRPSRTAVEKRLAGKRQRSLRKRERRASDED